MYINIAGLNENLVNHQTMTIMHTNEGHQRYRTMEREHSEKNRKIQRIFFEKCQEMIG